MLLVVVVVVVIVVVVEGTQQLVATIPKSFSTWRDTLRFVLVVLVEVEQ